MLEGFLNDLYLNNSAPVISAILLGLMTAISPCPMATNITAIGFIGKDIEQKRRVFYKGLIYTSGRIFSYTALALILYFGADQFKISGVFQQNGEKIIGPLLIIIGVFMLGLIKINFPGFSGLTQKISTKRSGHNYWQAFFLGLVFALAFCPYSGVLYFGILVPLSINSAAGLYLPAVYAIATGIPVIIFAWLIAYTISGAGKLYNKIKSFEYWFRRIVSILFIGMGVYYIIAVWG
ncbi:MAG: sulfite exporter TauE/SafE family protein [Bacteroidales bacterium]|nr:sulfite exporter TauE/SafE family protein [Bacteroidales bacterium]